ncbi:NifB/NifX family molybdenum-iron cluster-binding protein [Thermodesulforhabdus norvegica]|uniref:Uncharacterized protein n=1 Tax=Thermodesulforhabdus norvegica TaxID=39841 RepID=A0A1I4VSZ7_9BACT|nr:hypothetical protein [Thermodesulforhabdus norvegica]SFN04167.1 hypothetical protein SAMN05660836_02445 [Thermodesulforhabdus norvegica]
MGSKAAFSVWRNLIAPVFDVAREIRIVERSGNEFVSESIFTCFSPSPWDRVRLLREQQVQELFCGAISRPLFKMLRCSGILVVPFIAGTYREIKDAWVQGRFLHQSFIMPGCANYRKYFAEPVFYSSGENGLMGQQEREGPGPGGEGPGQRRRKRGQGAGPGGYCVCRNCGHKEPHKRGVPCSQEICPRCGGPMYRE